MVFSESKAKTKQLILSYFSAPDKLFMQRLSMCLDPVTLVNLQNNEALILVIQTSVKGFTLCEYQTV